jgi:hypothetical protein
MSVLLHIAFILLRKQSILFCDVELVLKGILIMYARFHFVVVSLCHHSKMIRNRISYTAPFSYYRISIWTEFLSGLGFHEKCRIIVVLCTIVDRLCGLVVRVSGYRSRGTGFDSRRFQIFWEAAGLERGPLSLVRTIEELLGRKSSGSGLENRD